MVEGDLCAGDLGAEGVDAFGDDGAEENEMTKMPMTSSVNRLPRIIRSFFMVSR